jgi:hypothetical protein
MFEQHAPEALPDDMMEGDAEDELHPLDVLKQMFPDVR